LWLAASLAIAAKETPKSVFFSHVAKVLHKHWLNSEREINSQQQLKVTIVTILT
jgi:hypothetical protein